MIGHGCFIIFNHGQGYMGNNHTQYTDFKYNQGDMVKVGTNGDELWWINLSSKKEFRTKVDFRLH
jgi:hypothetical protein